MTPLQLIDYFYFRKRLKRVAHEPPLFIIGHWRSGTTLLHNILCKDKRAAYVTTYHSVFPLHLRSRTLVGLFMKRLMPEYRPGDNIKMDMDYPQEEEYALSNITSKAFYHAFYFPHDWEVFYSQSVRFRGIPPKQVDLWKQKYSQLVNKACINTGGVRPVLKNPVNTARIKQLLQLYPRARFIFLVRHPAEVYCSAKKFFSAVIPTLSFQPVTKEEIGKTILSLYENLMKDYLSTKKLIPENQLYEMKYENLLAYPEMEIDMAYQRLNLGNPQQSIPSFGNYLNKQQTHKTDRYVLSKKEWDQISSRWEFAFKIWNYSLPESVTIVS